MNCMDFCIEDLDSIEELPCFCADKNKYDTVIIVPMGTIHESGYMNMTFLFCKGNEIICRSSGVSDSLHIDGIGGYGYWKSGPIPESLPPRAWSIDCLPNGYLRLFCSGKKINNGNGASDYEIFAIQR